MSLLLLLLALLVGAGGVTMCSVKGEPSIASQAKDEIPSWAKQEAFEHNPQALAGARLFAESDCTNCHTYLGFGSRNLGARDLSAEGTKGRTLAYLIRYMRCPSCVTPDSPMPAFAALGAKDLRLLAVFLEASKGPR